MDIKIFCAFSDLELRRHYKQWRLANPGIDIVREQVMEPIEGLGRFLGRTLYQVAVEFEPSDLVK